MAVCLFFFVLRISLSIIHSLSFIPSFLSSPESICLTLGLTGNNVVPVFSPDNHYISWIYHVFDQQYGSKKQIYILDLFTREKRILAESFDMQPQTLIWSPYLPDYILVQNVVRAKGISIFFLLSFFIYL